MKRSIFQFYFLLKLSAFFFALVCFSSVGYASSEADNVHVCLPISFEMQERDSIYAAAKHALNLNVGEPRTVRLIYFLPNDRPFRQEVVDSMKVAIRQIQTFYAEQMQAHGYGDKTFRFETDAQGDPLIHRVDGQHSDSHYHTYNTVRDAIGQVFDRDSNIYFIVVDNSFNTIRVGRDNAQGVARRLTKNSGDALVTGSFNWTTAAHELGHAFGLKHDFRDDAYIMSYGANRISLSACAAKYLAVHSYFNPDIPIEATQPPSIELISSPSYPSGSKSVSVQVKVSDSDGLHQVLLFTAVKGIELKACHGLAGEKDKAVEFEYDGIIPSSLFSNLSDLPLHLIYVTVLDTDGNEHFRSFTLTEISSYHLATLEGHTRELGSVSFSPDGRTLASGAYDSTIKLWDVLTRENVATLRGHRFPIYSVSFSPDGTMLASGAYDSTVKLWDVLTRENIATFEGHKRSVSSVSFSPDGATLASGSWDGTVVLWDVLTRENIAMLEGHTDGVSSVSFSPDGATLASGSWDDTVVLWDVLTRENVATLSGHTSRVNSVSFSRDGTTLASGSWDDTIMLWDVLTRENMATLSGHTDDIRSVSFSPDGATLASGSGDNTVMLWDTSEWLQSRPYSLEKISGDDQQGTPGAVLANPLIVEVRDQYGDPLPGVQLAFMVTTGEGRLSGKFTDEHSKTDVHGRAEGTLTLGPNPGTNTVGVSIGGRELVTFNAVGIGMPTMPITGGDYQTWHVPDGVIARLGKGRPGESDRAVAFLSDDQRLAVASGIGVWLYDVATSRALALLPFESEVSSMSFSPDETILALGLTSKVVLWDVAAGTQIATLRGHTSKVTSVLFSPDGTMLASGAYDSTIKLWDVLTRENIATLEGHTRGIRSVSFSPDGTMLASGAGDNTVVLWDVLTRENIATLEGHTRGIRSVSFSPDGTMLASGAYDSTIKLWDAGTRTNTATLELQRPIDSVSFSPDGRMLASGSSDETVRLWDVGTGENIITLEGHRGFVSSVSFSSDGRTLASGARNGTVRLWDVETGNFATLSGHTNIGTSVSFSPDGTMLASGSSDETVRLWDVRRGRNIATFKGHAGWVYSVSFSPDGTMLASGSSDETVRLWDVRRGRNIATFKGHTGWVYSVSFSPDGTMLASGSRDSTVKVWDVRRGRNIATFKGHTGWVYSVSFSPDGRTLASGSHDNTVKLWDVETRTNTATLELQRPVYSVLFSLDGTMLASGSWDGTKLWDIGTKTDVVTLKGHNRINSIVFSSDGTTLASASKDGTALLWDMSGYVTPVVYIPDANLQAVIRDALGKSRFAPITVTDMASLTTLDASNRNIRDLTGLEFATQLTELNLTDNPLSALSITTHIPALQERGVSVLFDKSPTPDFDRDGVVDFADFLQFVAQFGLSQGDAGYEVRFDLDGDGTIGFSDFLIFVDNFGKKVS